MDWKEEIIIIVQNIFYPEEPIEILKLKDFSTSEKRIIFLSNKICFDMEIEKNTLILGSIEISRENQNKGLCKEFIKKLILYKDKNIELHTFKIVSIVSSKINHICESLEMKKIDIFTYYEIDEQRFDIDGLFGSRII